MPVGYNIFREQFERVLPASSVANLYPFNYSGKTDPKGLFIGRDKYGTNILVDFDRRAEDKTNSNCLILGNSGQGKSFLLKLILTNFRESGKRVISLDPEAEYEELTKALGGCYIDFMSGEYIMACGIDKVMLCERGIRTNESFTRNTLDISAIPIIKKLSHLPVIVDPSHASGKSWLVEPLAMAAVAAGADGLIIEVHNDPPHALSDGAQSLTPKQFDGVAKKVFGLKKAVDKLN